MPPGFFCCFEVQLFVIWGGKSTNMLESVLGSFYFENNKCRKIS